MTAHVRQDIAGIKHLHERARDSEGKGGGRGREGEGGIEGSEGEQWEEERRGEREGKRRVVGESGWRGERERV